MKMLSMLCLALLPFATLADEVVPVDKVKNSINVRQEPDTASDVVAQLKQGSSLPLLKTLDGWYEVQLDGEATGFVSSDWARVVAETAAEEAPAPTQDSVPAESVEEAVAGVADEPDEGADAGDPGVIADVDAGAEAESAAARAAAAGQSLDGNAGPGSAPDRGGKKADEAEIVEQAPAVVEAQVLAGPAGPAGPPGPPGAASIKGSENFLVKFRKETEGGNSQIYDNGNQVGIGTTEPKQRLEVNGSIQIHERNSTVAGLMITQSAGETGYIMHNRASTLTIGAGSQDRITIDRDGNVGIGASKPSHPLELASGAHVTSGGVWTNSSSRAKKENIAALSEEQAMAALVALAPVRFNYRDERQEDYVGFIAEDVPDLVASRDRNTLSPMDIVAVLTRVVQAQQQKIEELDARLAAAENRR